MTYRLRPRAKADIEDIWSFSVEQWGPEKAAAYLGVLRSAIERAAANALIGQSIDEVRPGYRRLSAGSHVIFYKPSRGSIEIVRILHARMDFTRHL